MCNEWASDDEAFAICVQALRILHANPKVRQRAIAELKESIAVLRSEIESPRVQCLPDPRPAPARFQQFYAAMATFWEHA
jgi:hypothetical protein